MKDSSKPLNTDPPPAQRREPSPAEGLDLAVDPNWFSEEPKELWEAGYELSLEALRSALTQPEVWAARDREMVATEFFWK